VGRGVIGQAKEFKALQALTEQLNAAQQRAEENGKTEAAAARAAIQALAESVSRRLGLGDRVGPAFSQQSLSVPNCMAADSVGGCFFGSQVGSIDHELNGHMLLGEFNAAAGQDADAWDASTMLTACTVWLPPAACTDKDEAIPPSLGQQAKQIPVQKFSAWLPAASTSVATATKDDSHVDVAALLYCASSWLPSTWIDCPSSQVELSRVATWLPPGAASSSAAALNAGETSSTWLLSAASSANTAVQNANMAQHVKVSYL
jgi:hypothetical protein